MAVRERSPWGAGGAPAAAALPRADLPTPRTTIGAFPLVDLESPVAPAKPRTTGTSSSHAGARPRGVRGAGGPGPFGAQREEARARREAHRARRDRLRADRIERGRFRDGGRHDLGHPDEYLVTPGRAEPADRATGERPAPKGALIDVLEDVLSWSH